MRALTSLVVGLVAGLCCLAGPTRATTIDLGVSVTAIDDAATPQGFVFGLPSGLTGLVSYTGTLSIDLTDLGRIGDLVVEPLGTTFFEALADGVFMGGDSIGGAVTADFPTSIVFSGVFDCGAGCATIESALHFVMTGSVGDIASFTTRLEVVPFIAPVSEPATLALFLLVLAALAATRRPRVRPSVRAG
jgi:hypothetical protein